MLADYRAVLARVDAFAAEVAARRAADVKCRAGCDGCCKVELSVSPVEAESVRRHLRVLPADVRARVTERARHGLRHRCVMLEGDGTCAIYAARPLVCRTQGLPLRYPRGFVPADTVAARAGDDDVVWCPLNFTEGAPEGRDVLDAERVDLMLGLVNQRYCDAHGIDPLSRVALAEIPGREDAPGDP